MGNRIFKIIASWITALFVAYVFTSLILMVFRLKQNAILNIEIMIILFIISLPLYVIIRKKMFK